MKVLATGSRSGEFVRAQRDRLGARIDACDARRSKSPSHIEEFRTAVVTELLSWKAAGVPIDAESLLIAVERYDRAKGCAR